MSGYGVLIGTRVIRVFKRKVNVVKADLQESLPNSSLFKLVMQVASRSQTGDK